MPLSHATSAEIRTIDVENIYEDIFAGDLKKFTSRNGYCPVGEISASQIPAQ